jgi:hypothetical protein
LLSDPGCYKRLEETTPPLTSDDTSHTLVLRVLDSGRILRLEFETQERWGPEGWNVEQITVAHHPQLMGAVPTEFISTAPEGALRFETARIGTDISVKVKRTGLGPAESLTVRAVLLPVPQRHMTVEDALCAVNRTARNPVEGRVQSKEKDSK